MRITCTSTVDPTVSVSVTIIVPGDVTLNGVVGLEDATYVMDVYDQFESLPEVDENDKSTWYLSDLANVQNNDDVLNLGDVTAILDLYDKVSKF